jgi:hypothetical protein
VDKIEIYRTKDGGSTFYFLAEITHANPWSYTDSTADSGLDTSRIAPLASINDPAPTGASLAAFHMGRMWVAVDKYVYFGGGPDITNGVPEEAFPPTNVFTFPSKVQALVASAFGLLVFLTDDTYIIVGTDTFAFYPRLFQYGIGVLSQNAIAADGDTLYVHSSQRQILALSQTSIDEIGFPIGDVLMSTFDPASS